jgi:glycosyltransferase involved in cell wall biosynthesis
LYIGTLARLSPEKGVDLLMEAIKDLPDILLTIVGTGPEELALRAACLALPACHIHTKEEYLADFYRSLDLFVLPSREHDPFGLVAGEAMMMGVPVIVTDACGIAGYLQNNWDAVVVPANSSQELRNAIGDLLNDPEKRERMGREGKSTAEELFSMQRMVDEYEQTLTQYKRQE